MDKRTKAYKDSIVKAEIKPETPFTAAEDHFVKPDDMDTTEIQVEAPPVFTPMDTEKPPIAVAPFEYTGKVKAILNGDVAQLYIEGKTHLLDAAVFNQIFTIVPEKEVVAPPVKGKWSFTIHTPNIIPVEFRKENGTFDTVKMGEWLDADPKNVKAGIPGTMIGCSV